MKFLSKKIDSKILKEGITYGKGSNARLLNELLSEQHNFCAYTEKYKHGLDSFDVEHFNTAIKYNDDYYNYYAVLHSVNLLKTRKDKQYKEIAANKDSFFNSLFFQSYEEFNRRIRFIDNEYEEIDPGDIEAGEFIDFLNLNGYEVSEDRKSHVERLKKHFAEANYSQKEILEHFQENPQELSFITAIENELKINLTDLL